MDETRRADIVVRVADLLEEVYRTNGDLGGVLADALASVAFVCGGTARLHESQRTSPWGEIILRLAWDGLDPDSPYRDYAPLDNP